MKYKYYNDYGYKRAMANMETDPYTCARDFEKYFEAYPLDYTSYPYYISILILIGDFETAKKELDYIEEIYKSDIYSNDKKRNNILKYAILYSKFKLLCYEKKYQEAYDFYVKNINTVTNFDVEKIVFFCKVKLGLVEEQEREILPYFYRQTIDYQESDFLHHAKKHCIDTPHGNEDDETKFVSGFPIEEVVLEIKKYIPSDKRMYPGFVDNAYYFKYDRCGIANERLINFMKVTTFDGTNNIITMHPIIEGEKLPYVDLNYMILNNAPLVRRRSQIDKFNAKWNK